MSDLSAATRHDLTCPYDDCTGPHDHPGPERTPNVTVRQGGRVMVEVPHQTWTWTCDVCGWLGVGLFTPHSAWREAERHTEEHHPDIVAASSTEDDDA